MRHVLLTNDDGVFAPGLRALADAFLCAGFRVTVAAPDRERSAASHSITIKRPLVAVKMKWSGVPEGVPLQVFHVDGLPADCAKLALRELCEEAPELVVSGINNGWNVGTDVHYSGTVGAAMEAAFEGYAAMAVSVQRPSPVRYENAARLAVSLASRLLGSPLPGPSVLNVNLPDCEPEEVVGVVEAPLTPIAYSDVFHKLSYANSKCAYWLAGEIKEGDCLPAGDLDRLRRRYATVTALGWDLSMRGACGNLLQDLS